MAETISSEARRHVTRGRPRKQTLTPAPAAIADTPAPSSPASAPAPAAAVTSVEMAPIHWGTLGEQLGQLVTPLYVAIGAQVPPALLWQGFGVAWGKVIEHYVPGFNTGPLPAAIAMTTIVAVPIAVAWPAWKQKQRVEAAAAAATKRGEELRAA